MLAYVFWHRPADGEDIQAYETGLATFHEGLKAVAPSGFIRSAVFRVEGASWLPGGAGYEDWWLLRDAAALDALDTAAVSVGPRPAHDAVARAAGSFAGGLYGVRRDGVDPDSDSPGVWLAKPRGMSYDDFLGDLYARIPSEWRVWRRKMVLGPTPEFCAVGPGSPPVLDLPEAWRPLIVTRRRLWP